MGLKTNLVGCLFVAFCVLLSTGLQNGMTRSFNYGGSLSDRHNLNGKNILNFDFTNYDTDQRLLNYASMTPMHKILVMVEIALIWICLIFGLLFISLLILHCVYITFEVIGMIYMIQHQNEFLHVNYSKSFATESNRNVKSFESALFFLLCIVLQPKETFHDHVDHSNCKMCRALKQFKCKDNNCCKINSPKNMREHFSLLKKCKSVICKSCSILHDKQALSKSLLNKLCQCVKICLKLSRFPCFSAMLPHAVQTFQCLTQHNLVHFNNKLVNREVIETKTEMQTPVFCLEIRTCFSERTEIVNFSIPTITLADVKRAFTNDLGYPSEMFVFRKNDRRLVDSNIIELPCMITADVLLLGGGKRKHPPAAFKPEICDMCCSKTGNTGRKFPGKIADFVTKILLKPNCTFLCNKCRHVVRSSFNKHSRNCDMCDKSPDSEDSPIQLTQHETKFSLKVLKKDSTKVCKACSNNLADLLKQANKSDGANAAACLTTDSDCKSAPESNASDNNALIHGKLLSFAKSPDVIIATENIDLLQTGVDMISLADKQTPTKDFPILGLGSIELGLHEIKIVESYETNLLIDNPSMASDSTIYHTEIETDLEIQAEDLYFDADLEIQAEDLYFDADLEIPNKKTKLQKPDLDRDKTEQLIMSPIMKFKLQSAPPKCMISGSTVCKHSQSFVEIPSFFRDNDIKQCFSLEKVTLNSSGKNILCDKHYQQLVSSRFKSSYKRCIGCKVLLKNQKSVKFTSGTKNSLDGKDPRESGRICLNCYLTESKDNGVFLKIETICVDLEKSLITSVKQLSGSNVKEEP